MSPVTNMCLTTCARVEMFSQLDFVNKICSNFDYWSNSSVIKASIRRYELFMKLVAYERRRPPEIAAKKYLIPTIDIELIWRCHLTLPDNYDKYCATIGSTFIDHDEKTMFSADKDLEKAYARWVSALMTFFVARFNISNIFFLERLFYGRRYTMKHTRLWPRAKKLGTAIGE